MKPADPEVSGHFRKFRHTEQFEFVIFDQAHQRLRPPVTDNLEIKLQVPFPRPGRDAEPGVFILAGTGSHTNQAAASRNLHRVNLQGGDDAPVFSHNFTSPGKIVRIADDIESYGRVVSKYVAKSNRSDTVGNKLFRLL